MNTPEYATVYKLRHQTTDKTMYKKNSASRFGQMITNFPFGDEDPGIMSEVDTASTGFRRGGKQRSSLPVVRTPSKTLERPLESVDEESAETFAEISSTIDDTLDNLSSYEFSEPSEPTYDSHSLRRKKALRRKRKLTQ